MELVLVALAAFGVGNALGWRMGRLFERWGPK